MEVLPTSTSPYVNRTQPEGVHAENTRMMRMRRVAIISAGDAAGVLYVIV